MGEHPIENLMLTAMDSIRDMIDVNTIIGEAIEANNVVIIPISKVAFGFAAGGSEFKAEVVDEYEKEEKGEEKIKYKLPFGGGSGAGVSIAPIGFLTVDTENKCPRFVPVEHKCSVDKLLEYIPDLFEKVEKMMCKKDKQNNNEKQNYTFYNSKVNEEINKEESDEENQEDD